ncbi:hypothetical protein [Streptomyces sp. MP131-18]|uniref:hypothetical protein n=1 Tax=Streptomyces sp. MP131-18 TaxID=1857892 RepID=UPI00097C79E7|nr:hypothetical protein [Streptomyces sp. MP131-18]ONK09495.1 hypothetical protein STBA_01950 [Streptomyces sp. MP131-18]
MDDIKHNAHLVFDMLAAAVADDTARAADLLQQIGESSTPDRMYGVCCALAAAGTNSLRSLYGEHAPDLSRGDMWAMQTLPNAGRDSQSSTWASRFLIAYANGDKDTPLALFNASVNDGDRHVDDVASLLITVTGITRLALREQNGAAS